jgi:hypothetical protein
VLIPVGVFTKKSASTIYQWSIEDVPIYNEDHTDYWEDEDGEVEDKISAYIITPTEHKNKTKQIQHKIINTQ